MTENWYIVLGLEYDPNPVTDEKIISEKIDEKRKFWVTESRRNPMKKTEYGKYLDLLDTIKAEMLGPKNIREELIRDACVRKYAPIDDALKVIQRTEVPEDIIENIANKQNVSVDMVKDRANRLGYKIIASRTKSFQAIYDEYYVKEPEGIDKYNGDIPNLKIFNATSLYEFLYGDSTVAKPQNLRCESLRQRAKERKEKEFDIKHDTFSTAGGHLCSSCQEYFKNENTKKQYDEYLGYTIRRQLLDDVKKNWDYTKEFNRSSYDNVMGKLTEVFQDKAKAQKLLEAFCFFNEIPIPGVEVVQSSNKESIKKCRCGVANDISDGRKICRSCGLDLQIKCPKCGDYNDNTVSICKCGNKLDGIVQALSLCLQAEKQIEANAPSEAEKSVAEAQRLWPECDRIKGLREKITRLSIQKKFNNAEELRYNGDKEEYIYIMREYEKENPVQANINMADTYLFDYEDDEKKSEVLACAKKLKRLHAKEGYLFMGLIKLRNPNQNYKGAKRDLKQFLKRLQKDNDRSKWADPNRYEVLAKFNLAFALASSQKPTMKELKQSRLYYKEVVESSNVSRNLSEFAYEDINNIEARIKEKRKKMIGAIVACAIVLACILVIAVLIVRHRVLGNKLRRNLEEAQKRIEQMDVETPVSILNYTISKDTPVEEMEYVMIDSISASSELTDSAGYVYKAANMTDMDSTSSWQENESGGGEGSSISISLSQKAQIKGIAFQLGSHKNEGNYKKNNRPKTLNISINGESCDYSFEDEYCWHTILFNEPIETDSVLIEIKEIYPGNVWNDTCIAEVRLLK